jgi:hypothetical protein
MQSQIMNEAAIIPYVKETLPNVETADNFGNTFFFYRWGKAERELQACASRCSF